MAAEVSALPYGPRWVAVCSQHGIVSHWSLDAMAAWAAIGHTTAHHSR